MAGYVVGLVGPFGSGCSFTADIINQVRGNYEKISLSEILRELAKEEGHSDLKRQALQDYGNEVRSNRGVTYLAEKAVDIISSDTDKNYIIDSIRNPEEVVFFRKNLPNFFLFGIFSDPDVRWNRVKNIYSDDRRTFDVDDKRDSGEGIRHGQRVTDTFRMADIIILNNENIFDGNDADRTYREKVREKLDLIERIIPFRPTNHETNMTMAYASSMRSSCIKRKVGALIVDKDGNAFSSGYNEVPSMQKPCQNEYGTCYRDHLKKNFRTALHEILSEDHKAAEEVFGRFKSNFKILDYCRSLHAEENAILNVAKIGASSSLSESTLYTTIYPCNLCANKITQVGIREVVYFEPYPMEEAKKILTEKTVIQTPFEGVTYNGYFKFMEVTE